MLTVPAVPLVPSCLSLGFWQLLQRMYFGWFWYGFHSSESSLTLRIFLEGTEGISKLNFEFTMSHFRLLEVYVSQETIGICQIVAFFVCKASNPVEPVR